MAAVDILYIDITRRWNAMTLDQRDSGTPGCGLHKGWVAAHLFLLEKGLIGRKEEGSLASWSDIT